LEAVSHITLSPENIAFREFVRRENLREKLEQGIQVEETLQRIEEAFEKLVSERIKKMLNAVKKKERDAIRRKLILMNKQPSHDVQLPTHLNLTVIPFIAQDIGLLIRANGEHVKKFRMLRETDFTKYEMEKRFLEELHLRHIKSEEQRKIELEKIEAEKARRASVKMEHPMSEDAAKDIWEEKEQLPREEFNYKTYFALNDLDSNGFLDLEEIKMLIRKLLDNGKIPGYDMREKIEIMEKMRDQFYKEADKNGDLLIDFEEFVHNDKMSKNNRFNDESEGFSNSEFEEYERKRLNEIRQDIAEGKKPEGYNYEDVPLLDGNFLNETHIMYEGVLMKVDDSPHEVREKNYKEYAMEKQFEDEEALKHIKDPLKRRKMEIEKEIEKGKSIKIHKPLSTEQLKKAWKEQDHEDELRFNLEKFYNLHDINGDKLIDRQEVRMMAISDLTASYKEANTSVETRQFSEDLEKLREEIEEADTDKDGFINKQEFFAAVAEMQRVNGEREKIINEESRFTEEEYKQFRDERILEIRKMIVNGKLPINYNYTDVPLLFGYFLNETHIMRDGVMMETNRGQTSHMQQAKDFKRFKMEARFKYEHDLENMSPEEQKREGERVVAQMENERKMKHKKIAYPLSETQEKEVWEKEDKMDPSQFTLQKYFKLHDVDASGKWNKQEVAASLMKQLDEMFDKADPFLKEKKSAELESWLRYVFGTGDLDKDGEIDLTELTYLNKLSNERMLKEWDEWKDMEAGDEYTQDEWEKFKKEH